MTGEINSSPPPQSPPMPSSQAPKAAPVAQDATSGDAKSVAAGSGLADRTSAVASLSEVTADIREAMTVLNETLSIGPTSASISRDNELNTFIVRIFDDDSGEIIREIPNEAMQRFARNLKEIHGLIFDEKL